MGLAGRKLKQRIGNDPRNLSWADDANKFGTAYLSKLGWSSGSGLGTNGDGMTSHIKVNQKLDMLGIGAAHQKDPNGIAWKQNKDFENLLKRLNAGGEEVPKVDGFAKAKDMTEEEGTEKELGEEVAKKRKRVEGEDNGKKKKSKATDESDEDATEKKKSKKKSKVSDGLKKSKKERNRDTSTDDDDAKVPSKGITPVSVTPTVPRPFRAHRARFLASKRLASTSSTAVDEILGISRSGTTTPYPSTSIPNTPLDDSSPDSLKLQELTTSSKSVMDYFKEKLLAKSNSASTSITAATTPASPSTPYDDDGDYGDRPRGGLGIGAARGGLGAGSSKLRTAVTFSEETEESGRSGLGSRSRMSVMFAAATTPVSSSISSVAEKVEVDSTAEVEENTEDAERPKKSKKDKKDKKCEGKFEQVEEESDTMKKSKKHKSERKRKAKEGEGDDVVAAVKEDLPSEHNDKKKGKKKARGTEEIEVKYAISTDSRDVVEDAEDTGGKESKKRKSKRKAETEVALDSDAERKKKKKEKKSKRAQGDA